MPPPKRPAVWKCAEPGCNFTLAIQPELVDETLDKINEHKYEHARARAQVQPPKENEEPPPGAEALGGQEEMPAPAPEGEVQAAVRQLIENNNQIVAQFKQMADTLVSLAQRVQNIEQRGTNNQPQFVIPPGATPQQEGAPQGGMAGVIQLAQALGIGKQTAAPNPLQNLESIRGFLDGLTPITNWLQSIRLGGFQEATEIFSRSVRGGIAPEEAARGQEEYIKTQQERLAKAQQAPQGQQG